MKNVIENVIIYNHKRITNQKKHAIQNINYTIQTLIKT